MCFEVIITNFLVAVNMTADGRLRVKAMPPSSLGLDKASVTSCQRSKVTNKSQEKSIRTISFSCSSIGHLGPQAWRQRGYTRARRWRRQWIRAPQDGVKGRPCAMHCRSMLQGYLPGPGNTIDNKLPVLLVFFPVTWMKKYTQKTVNLKLICIYKKIIQRRLDYFDIARTIGFFHNPDFGFHINGHYFHINCHQSL